MRHLDLIIDLFACDRYAKEWKWTGVRTFAKVPLNITDKIPYCDSIPYILKLPCELLPYPNK